MFLFSMGGEIRSGAAELWIRHGSRGLGKCVNRKAAVVGYVGEFPR